MKRITHLCFLLALLLLGACDDSLSDRQRNLFSGQHEYPVDETNGSSVEGGPPFVNLPDDGNRWIWQKPDIVIERLGDLKGKTVADIGAGPYGYFSLRIVFKTPAEKVLALDIDKEAIQFMNQASLLLPEELRARLETRLVAPDDPKLKEGEADVVFIVNTYPYIENRVDYFSRLREGIAAGGKLVIIEFKKRITPVGPPLQDRLALGEVEQELLKAGYSILSADDRTLDYQYILEAGLSQQ